MAENFVRLRLTRQQAQELFNAVDDDDDAVSFEGSVNGQPITVRVSATNAD